MRTKNAQNQPDIPIHDWSNAFYGLSLLTRKEQHDYKLTLRRLKTLEERNMFRLNLYKKMQLRARKQGLVLPTLPTNSNLLG